MTKSIHEYLKSGPAAFQLMVLFILLNILDFQTTQILIGYEGFEVEQNPLLYHLMVQADSVWILLPFKLLTLVVVWFGLRAAEKFNLIGKNRSSYVLVTLCVAFFLVVLSNTSMIYLSQFYV